MIRERVLERAKVDVFTDLARVEALWRMLEADPSVLATPYQRFDWVAAFAEAEGRSGRPGEGLRVLVVSDVAGRARMVMPLRVARERGLRVARAIGGKHANFHMPLFASREAATMEPEDLRAALVRAGREAGIDVFCLDHQPRFWDGAANPLSAGGHPCASDAYGLHLGPDAEATLKRIYSGDARKKLRAKERKLVEAHGPVEYRAARTPEAVAEILSAFYAQKAARMAAMGLPDPYGDDEIRQFLASAAAGAGASPAIEVHALVATATGRVLATFGGAVDRDRFSGMWTSFDTDPELGRYSPGDLLLHNLIGRQTQAGRRAFDLGVGEARYKANICDETIELVKTVIPVSVGGQVFALGAIGAGRLKARIKRSPRLCSMLQRLRRAKAARSLPEASRQAESR